MLPSPTRPILAMILIRTGSDRTQNLDFYPEVDPQTWQKNRPVLIRKGSDIPQKMANFVPDPDHTFVGNIRGPTDCHDQEVSDLPDLHIRVVAWHADDQPGKFG